MIWLQDGILWFYLEDQYVDFVRRARILERMVYTSSWDAFIALAKEFPSLELDKATLAFTIKQRSSIIPRSNDFLQSNPTYWVQFNSHSVKIGRKQ